MDEKERIYRHVDPIQCLLFASMPKNNHKLTKTYLWLYSTYVVKLSEPNLHYIAVLVFSRNVIVKAITICVSCLLQFYFMAYAQAETKYEFK